MQPERLTIPSGDLVDERLYRLRAETGGGTVYSDPAQVRLITQAPAAAWSTARRLPFCRDYDGPIVKLRRLALPYDTRDFYPTGPDDAVDIAEIQRWVGINRLTTSVAAMVETGAFGVGALTVAGPRPSPDGRYDAVQFQVTSMTSQHTLNFGTVIYATYTERYTFVAWLRGGAQRFVALAFYNATEANSLNAVFDLQLGRVARKYSGLWGSVSASMTHEGDGWYRCELSGVCPNTTFSPIISAADPTATTAVAGYGSPAWASSTKPDFTVWRTQVQTGTYEGIWTPPASGTTGFTTQLVTIYDQVTGAWYDMGGAVSLVPVTSSGVGLSLMNGRLAADYQGTQNRVTSGTAGVYNFLHTTGGAIYMAARPDTTAGTKTLFSTQVSTTNPGVTIRVFASGGVGVLVGRLDVAGVATAGNSVNALLAAGLNEVPFVGVVNIDPDNATPASRATGYINSLTPSTANASSGTPFVENAGTSAAIGVRSSTERFDGRISEVAIFPDLLSSDDVQRIMEDAAGFYGITLG